MGYSIYDFRYNTSTAKAEIPATYKGKPVIRIDKRAFEDCSKLTNITIPTSVTYIERDAFYYHNGPMDITFQGTKAQWQNIKKSYDWHYGNNFVIHCADGNLDRNGNEI